MQFTATLDIIEMMKKFSDFRGTLVKKKEKLMQTGRSYVSKGKFDQALLNFDEAVQLSKQLSDDMGVHEALNEKASALVSKGNLKKALTIYRSLSKKWPQEQYQFDIGYILAELGQYEDSLNSYKLYLKLYPDDYVALSNVGGVYEHLKKYDLAEEYYRASLRIKRNYVSALSSLVILLDQRREEDSSKSKEAIAIAKKALEIYNRNIKQTPKDTNLLVSKAIAIDVLGEKQKAIEIYGQALKIEPRNAFALYNKSCTTCLIAKEKMDQKLEKESQKLIKQSLKLLEMAIQEDSVYLELAREDNDFRFLRDNTTFKKLVKLSK